MSGQQQSSVRHQSGFQMNQWMKSSLWWWWSYVSFYTFLWDLFWTCLRLTAGSQIVLNLLYFDTGPPVYLRLLLICSSSPGEEELQFFFCGLLGVFILSSPVLSLFLRMYHGELFVILTPSLHFKHVLIVWFQIHRGDSCVFIARWKTSRWKWNKLMWDSLFFCESSSVFYHNRVLYSIWYNGDVSVCHINSNLMTSNREQNRAPLTLLPYFSLSYCLSVSLSVSRLSSSFRESLWKNTTQR